MADGGNIEDIQPVMLTHDIVRTIKYPSTVNVYLGDSWMNIEKKKRKKHCHELVLYSYDIIRDEITVQFNNFRWQLFNENGVYKYGNDREPIYILYKI